MSDQQATGGTKRPRMSLKDSSSQSGGKHPFLSLPIEILNRLTLFLDDEDLARLSRTCTLWRDILKDESIWETKCRQNHLQPNAVVLRTSPTPWRDRFLEKILTRRNWRCPHDVVVVRSDKEASRNRGWVIAVGSDRVLTLDELKTLKAWSCLTGELCWERRIDTDDVFLNGLILNADFRNGRGTVISPESGETIETWDMGVITKVAIHNGTVVSVSDEGHLCGGGCLRFWSPDDPSYIASVPIADFNVDHLIFDSISVIIVYSSGDIEVWDAAECSLQHSYPNQAPLTSLVFDERRIYTSSASSEFVRVWSLEEHHETELVAFERNSTLYLSKTLLIGIAPNNRVKVWDKREMKCQCILDLGSSIIGVSVQSTHLITHKAGRAFNIRDLSAKTLEGHDMDLDIPEDARIRNIHTTVSKLVVDVRRRNESFYPLLIFDFTRAMAASSG